MRFLICALALAGAVQSKAAEFKTTLGGVAAGEVTLTCPEPGGWTFALEREALVVVSDFADGGEYRVKPDAAAMCLKDGFRAYDFESGAELPFKDGAATVTIPKHDFRIVEFR